MLAKLLESWTRPRGGVFNELPLVIHVRRDAKIPEMMPTALIQFRTAEDAKAALEKGDCRHRPSRRGFHFVKSEREFDMVKLCRRRAARGHMRWCEPRVCWDGSTEEGRHEAFEDGTRGWGQWMHNISDIYFYFDEKYYAVTPDRQDDINLRSANE